MYPSIEKSSSLKVNHLRGVITQKERGVPMKLYRSIKNGPTVQSLYSLKPITVELGKSKQATTGLSVVTIQVSEFENLDEDFTEFRLYGSFGVTDTIIVYGKYHAEKKAGWLCFEYPDFYNKRRKRRLHLFS